MYNVFILDTNHPNYLRWIQTSLKCCKFRDCRSFNNFFSRTPNILFQHLENDNLLIATRKLDHILSYSKLFFFSHFQACVAFDIKTKNLIGTANQITGFYMENSTRQKWVKNGCGTSCQFTVSLQKFSEKFFKAILWQF